MLSLKSKNLILFSIIIRFSLFLFIGDDRIRGIHCDSERMETPSSVWLLGIALVPCVRIFLFCFLFSPLLFSLFLLELNVKLSTSCFTCTVVLFNQMSHNNLDRKLMMVVVYCCIQRFLLTLCF